MKSMFLQLARTLVGNDLFWSTYDRSFGRWHLRLQSLRDEVVRQRRHAEAIHRLIPDQTVRYGPFRGMHYTLLEACGSTLFPKLVGSYESELHSLLERISDRPYQVVLNIGCAEGYYAVGLARYFSEASVFAWDVDPIARQRCQVLAETNNVAARLRLSDSFSVEQLPSLTNREAGLVWCDCEGAERMIFSPEIIPRLSNYDLLIEVHDGIDPEISFTLSQRFAATHHVQSIPAFSDLQRAKASHIGELSGLNLTEKCQLLEECRHPDTHWLWMERKNRI